jgi:hypothetical protein
MAPRGIPASLRVPYGVEDFWCLGLGRNEPLLRILLRSALDPKICVYDDTNDENLRRACETIEESKDSDFRSSLLGHLVASRADRRFLVEAVLALGLDPATVNGKGHSAVSVAVFQGNVECAKALLLCRPWNDLSCLEALECYNSIDKRREVNRDTMVLVRFTPREY